MNEARAGFDTSSANGLLILKVTLRIRSVPFLGSSSGTADFGDVWPLKIKVQCSSESR
jgi:hypothetical protein